MALFIGAIIMVAGLFLYLRETGWIVGDINILGPFVVIVLGILMVAGAKYGLSSRR